MHFSPWLSQGRLPSDLSRTALIKQQVRLSVFAPQIAKADKYLAGWQASLLNQMGHATLVNSVLDNRLIYAMCALAIPPGVIDQVDRKRRSFYGLVKGPNG